MKKMKHWIIEELPGKNGWWSDGYLEYIDAAQKMIDHGMSQDVVMEILKNLYNAVASEYGD